MTTRTVTNRVESASPERVELLAVGVGAAVVVYLSWLAATFPALFVVDGIGSARGVVVLAVGLALGLLFLHSPVIALCGLVAFVFLNLSEVLVRRHQVPSLLQVSAVPLALAGLGAGWPARRQPPLGLTTSLLVFLGVLLLSTLVAADREAADWRLFEHAKGFAVFVLVVSLASSGAALRKATWTMAASAALIASLALVQVATGNFDVDFGGLARIKQAHIHGSTFEPRITGPLGDPNFFAQVLLLAMPLALSLAWTEARPRRRFLALALAAATGTACLFTYSRGGAIALAVVLAVVAVHRGADLRRISAVGAMLVVLAGIAAPQHFVGRLKTLGELLPGGEEALRPDSSFQERRLFAAVAWRMFQDHPLLGVGVGNYAWHFVEYAERTGSDARLYVTPGEGYYPHNLYLEIAAETGVLGLAAAGVVLLASAASLSSARRRLAAGGDHASAALAFACQVALAGFLVTSLFLHGHFIRYLWLILGFTGALTRLADRRPATGLETWPPPSPPSAVANVPRHGPSTAGSGGGHRAEGQPRVRSAVAVLVSRFPLVTETFVLREIIELERQGQPVRLVPLIRETPAVVHREALPWVARALHTPLASSAILAANVRMLGRRPWRYLHAFAQVACRSLPSPNFFVRSVALFPKSVFLADQLQREGIRHLHAHFASHPATVAWIASMLTDATFSVSVHAHDIFVRQTLLRPKLRAATFIRAISRFNRDYLVKRYPELATRTAVIHVGLHPASYAAPRHPPRPGACPSSGATPKILCVASLRRYKGLPVLVEACRLLRRAGHDFRCEVVGEGPMHRALERQIGHAGLADVVCLLGARPQHEVADLLRDATMLVQPSIVAPDGQMEGIPVAIMEAMAAGLPVVASALSGIPEAVGDGTTGLLVPPGSPEALASALATLLADPVAARLMGEAGRRVVDQEFRIDRCVSQLLHHLDQHVPARTDLSVDSLPRVRDTANDGHVGVRRVIDGRDARVVHVVTSAGDTPRELVLKLHRPRPGESRSALERALREYEVLRGLSSHAPGRCAPRPLFFDPASACVGMEPCRGESLDQLIRTARTRAPGNGCALESAVRCAGDWLREFHATTENSRRPGQVLDQLLAAARRDLDGCATRGLSRRVSGAAWSQMLALRARLDPASVRVTATHGDFWPGNIYFDGRAVQVIDFEGVGPGLPYADLAYFLVQLEQFFAAPLVRARFDHLAAQFLQAYLCGSHTFDWTAYELCRMASALRILALAPQPPRPWQLGTRRRHRILREIVTGGAM